MSTSSSLLLIDNKEEFEKPQPAEHLRRAEMMASWCALPSLQGGRTTSKLKTITAIDLVPAGKSAGLQQWKISLRAAFTSLLHCGFYLLRTVSGW